MSRDLHRRRGGRGFSLVEIMVALLISAIVLLTVFFVFVTNTEHYYRQEQVVQMQERMRFALNGLLLQVEGERVELVATDGRRLALEHDTCTNPGEAALRAIEAARLMSS